jgi:PKD repeat protein
MYNHRLDILPEDWRYDGVYSPELNRKFVVGTSPVQWSKLFVIDGPDRLVGTDALNALLSAFNNPNIDDIDLVLKFKVENPNPLVADFSAVTTTGPVPFTVQFTDTSSGNPTSYLWNFGDNTTATVSNPAHTYFQTGTFTVSLTVSNGGVSSTTTKNNYIVATGATPTPTPTTTPQPGGSTISLYPGWNFVSTPKTLASGHNTIGTVFSGVDTAAHSVFLYNTLTNTWVPLNSTAVMNPLDGIWIYSNNAMQVNLQFNTDPLTPPPTKQLYAGWNGIGSGETQPITAQNALLTVQNAWAKLIGFNAAAQAYDPTIFNSNPSYTAPVYPTRGYWVFMSSAGVYS